jgi:hypothetical protein
MITLIYGGKNNLRFEHYRGRNIVPAIVDFAAGMKYLD